MDGFPGLPGLDQLGAMGADGYRVTRYPDGSAHFSVYSQENDAHISWDVDRAGEYVNDSIHGRCHNPEAPL